MLRRIFEGEDAVAMDEVKNVEEEGSIDPSGKGGNGNDEDVGDFNFPEPVLA